MTREDGTICAVGVCKDCARDSRKAAGVKISACGASLERSEEQVHAAPNRTDEWASTNDMTLRCCLDTPT